MLTAKGPKLIGADFEGQVNWTFTNEHTTLGKGSTPHTDKLGRRLVSQLISPLTYPILARLDRIHSASRLKQIRVRT